MHPYRESAPHPLTSLAVVEVAKLQVGDVVRVTLDERTDLRGRTGEIGVITMRCDELHAVTFSDHATRFYTASGLALQTQSEKRLRGVHET